MLVVFIIVVVAFTVVARVVEIEAFVGVLVDFLKVCLFLTPKEL